MPDSTYIKEYSRLNPQEQRQLHYKRRFKHDRPDWNDSMVLLTRMARERLPSQARLLDFGCGRGNFVVDEIGHVFSEKVGFDVDAQATMGNKSMNRVVHGSIDTIPFPDAFFDVVISLWVLEHLPHPEKTLQEISRVLKPGGFCAFATPNRRSLLITLRRLFSKRLADRILEKLYGRQDKDAFDVFYRVNTTRDIERFAQRAGLIVEHLWKNTDPSYTSFNFTTYALSKWMTYLPGTWFEPHLVGILRKAS